jgi:hypothetical protein
VKKKLSISTKRPIGTETDSTIVKHNPSKRVIHEKGKVAAYKLDTTTSSVAMVRHAVRLTLSLPNTYNSVSVEVAIEMPMPCEPGDIDTAVRHSKKVEQLVESRFEGKAREMKQLLKDLARDNQR